MKSCIITTKMETKLNMKPGNPVLSLEDYVATWMNNQFLTQCWVTLL